jgi:hypothetical protein
MLIRPSSFEQFDQRVSEKIAWPHFRQFEGSYKTNESTWNKSQIAQNGVKLNPKPTPRNKRNKIN